MTITPVTASEPDAQTANPVAANLQALRTLFPDAFTEGKVDFDTLRQLLGEAVEDGDERYGLNWNGKRRARRLALQPSLGTLRPAKEDSLDWDKTRNLVIEGDNLEVLKLLTKPYADKVKLIYIDPPYNTGNDFVYPDDYADSLGNYLRRTGQVDGAGIKNTSNPESSGRYHTDWLNMMYPRLMLARGLLANDGLIAINIDDREAPSVRQICDILFGEENFVANIIWQKKYAVSADEAGIGVMHDNIILYSKSNSFVRGLLPRTDTQNVRYTNPDEDLRGPWASDNYVSNKSKEERPTLWYSIVHPKTGEAVWPESHAVWRYSPDKHEQLEAEGRLYWGPGQSYRKPRLKRYLSEVQDGIVPSTWWTFSEVGHNDEAQKEVGSLLERKVFSTPKPLRLLFQMLRVGNVINGVVLDFFAGSGTTGHAVMAQNAVDGGNRRYILVQLPESLDPANKDQKTAAEFCDSIGKPRTIAELTKERLRRAAAKVRAEHPDTVADLGFRVYKLATSNLKAWQPRMENAEALAADLVEAADNLLQGRTEDDLLVELLLKRGIDLAEPMLTREADSRTYQAFGGGVLITYLGDVAAADAEAVATAIADWIVALNPVAPAVVFFRDIGFENDIAKANVDALLRQRLRDRGPGQPDLLEVVRSV